MDEFDRWHLFGNEGCIHEHDDDRYVAQVQAGGGACDCPERAAWELTQV